MTALIVSTSNPEYKHGITEEYNTVEELLNLVKESGNSIILRPIPVGYKQDFIIELYDDYRE